MADGTVISYVEVGGAQRNVGSSGQAAGVLALLSRVHTFLKSP